MGIPLGTLTIVAPHFGSKSRGRCVPSWRHVPYLDQMVHISGRSAPTGRGVTAVSCLSITHPRCHHVRLMRYAWSQHAESTYLQNISSRSTTSQIKMPYVFDEADPTLSPAQVRSLCREDSFRSGGTPGYCPGYTQANVLILPSRYANDFRTFCQRNPVSCPLLDETAVGDPAVPSNLAKTSDIRTDCGQYCVYENGKLQNVKRNLMDEWTNESVGFLIGCSYSFEGALLADGFGLRHVEERKVLPVYKTSVQLMPAGGWFPPHGPTLDLPSVYTHTHKPQFFPAGWSSR